MSLLREFADLRPAGGFSLIMADNPWRYTMYSEKGEAKSPTAHYECQSIDWLKALPVGLLSAENCLLWLWALNPMLPEALAVIEAWGFTFKTAGTWVKRTVHGKDAFGTGYVLRSSNEPFLIATRGSPKTTRSTRSTVASYDNAAEELLEAAELPLSSITIEAAVRAHSQKPEEAYAAAEALMPDVNRLELFSRTDRPGWKTWGDQAGTFVPEQKEAAA